MVVPLLPAFLVSIGGGAEALGVIEGAAEATASLFKYLSGRWADRARRLLPLAVLALLGVRETSTATPTTTSTPNTTSTATRPPGSLLAAIFLFTLGNSTDALLLLRAQSLGVRTELVPVLWSMLHVVRAASS